MTKEHESQSGKGPGRLGDWALILRLTFVELHFFFPETAFFFSVALELVLELALVDQAGLELTEICLPLPP